MAASVIKLQDITKVFATEDVETHALSSVSVEINKGDYVSIAGPSGCGKSTLLSILGLLDSPTKGSYWLNGQPVSDLPELQRAHLRNREIGFIFQSFNLIGDLSVAENVELPLVYRGIKPADRKTRVAAALERVGMAHRAKHMPSQLSGGQQQRVAVARAVAGEPAILLADEPTGNLDSKSGEAVMLLLSELHKAGATICMVTHDPRYAKHAGRAIHLFDGKVVSGPTCPVERMPPDPGCTPRPLAATLRVHPAGKRAPVETVHSESNGRFSLRLAPGLYVVRPQSRRGSAFPRPASPRRVRVRAGRFTYITITYDTGIR